MHTVALVEALKRALKTRGITYAALAARLGLSEASVKRMFSRRDFTLQRMDDVCTVAGVDFGEIVQDVSDADTGTAHLTVQQEEEIVSDPKLMLVALCAVGNWTFEQIVDTYDMPRMECVRHLARLDHQRIIESSCSSQVSPQATGGSARRDYRHGALRAVGPARSSLRGYLPALERE